MFNEVGDYGHVGENWMFCEMKHQRYNRISEERVLAGGQGVYCIQCVEETDV